MQSKLKNKAVHTSIASKAYAEAISDTYLLLRRHH